MGMIESDLPVTTGWANFTQTSLLGAPLNSYVWTQVVVIIVMLMMAAMMKVVVVTVCKVAMTNCDAFGGTDQI